MIDPDARAWWHDGREMIFTKRPAHEQPEYLAWFLENECGIVEYMITKTYIGFLNETDITLFWLKYK